MKITRYFQSCILIEENEARILIDPSGQETERVNQFGLLDAVLYTHEHPDHFEPILAADFANKKADIYANGSTASKMSNTPTTVNNGDKFEIKGVEVKAIELPHCLMIDGSEGPQNTGYLINNKFFHPGDGKQLEGVSAEVLALPITGPDISFKDSADFAKQLGSNDVIPIHYDFIGTKPDVFARLAGDPGFRINVLGVGDSIEL